MMSRRLPRYAAGSLVVLAIASIASAAAATNTVGLSRVGVSDYSASPWQLGPPECRHLALTRIQIGSGAGGGNAMVFGTSDGGTLSGGGGDDCIVGSATNDTLQGQGGNDVLIGGAGALVVLNGGGGTDTCYRGKALAAVPISCEQYVP